MKKILCILSLGVLLGSCDGRLDVSPQNSIPASGALATSSDVSSLLRGGYQAMGNEYVYGGAIQYDSDFLGDDGEIQFTGTYNQPKQIINKSILINNTFVSFTWTDSYRAINITNTVLSALDRVVDADKKVVEGGAKFIRGSLYFELTRLFGKAWNDGSPASNLAVPLVLTPTNADNPDEAVAAQGTVSRNTVAELYAQVITDLQDAEQLLPKSNGVYATTYAASAMLSRVYLQQGKYAEAAVEANKVIASGNFSLVNSYADEFISKTNTSESIFDIQLTAQSGTSDLNTFYSSNSRGDVTVLDKHLAMYEAGDERLDLFDTSGGSDGALTTKFDNIHGNVHLIRLAEMYLTRAEGNFRAGTTVGATPLKDINTIRARVGLPALAAVTLLQILEERHLELAFEGFLLHDLKRDMLSVGDLPYNSPKLVFPIPQRERDLNANLVQNEGY